MPLTINDLTFKPKEHPTVRFECTVEDQQFVGLIGSNGAGKSTFLKLITGECPSTNGDITIGNFSVRNNPQDFKERIGYMPDVFPIDKTTSVKEFLDWVAICKRIDDKLIDAKVNSALEQFELASLQSKNLHQLSLGQRQRVSQAQSFIGNPEFLLLDEPLNGLDPTQQEKFWRQFKNQTQQPGAIIASHHWQDLIDHCDRLLIMDRFQLVADFDLTQNSYVIAVNHHQPNDETLSAFKVPLSHNLYQIFDSEKFNNITRQVQHHIVVSGTLNECLPKLFQLRSTEDWSW